MCVCLDARGPTSFTRRKYEAQWALHTSRSNGKERSVLSHPGKQQKHQVKTKNAWCELRFRCHFSRISVRLQLWVETSDCWARNPNLLNFFTPICRASGWRCLPVLEGIHNNTRWAARLKQKPCFFAEANLHKFCDEINVSFPVMQWAVSLSPSSWLDLLRPVLHQTTPSPSTQTLPVGSCCDPAGCWRAPASPGDLVLSLLCWLNVYGNVESNSAGASAVFLKMPSWSPCSSMHRWMGWLQSWESGTDVEHASQPDNEI